MFALGESLTPQPYGGVLAARLCDIVGGADARRSLPCWRTRGFAFCSSPYEIPRRMDQRSSKLCSARDGSKAASQLHANSGVESTIFPRTARRGRGGSKRRAAERMNQSRGRRWTRLWRGWSTVGKRRATTGDLSGSLQDSSLLITNKGTRRLQVLVSSMLSCNLTQIIVR